MLTLDLGETLLGVVRRPDGSPLPGGGVKLPGIADERETAFDGSFRISGLPAGSVEVKMRDPRFLPFETTVTLPLLAPVEFTVRLGAVLFVRATDEDGHPATRRHVRICPDGEEERSAASGRTNAEGEFRARLLPGKYRIRVGTRD